ncbi:carboxypeptidase-like regulatory domain-containing protein [Nibribacter koreensis]|uniref:CarboxypepD_reg-like domain-containing protein n=1 Tax=Nibribacter koreensis TaxID=1084519 RepID=A0ABP8FNT5_9BACT
MNPQGSRKGLIPVSISKKRWIWLAAALGLSAWLSIQGAEAKPIASTQLQKPAAICSLSDNQSLIIVKVASSDSIKVLKGKVLDSASKEPMPGVTVMWKGTSTGVPTNAKGQFTIAVTEGQLASPQTLVVSFIGYLKQEIVLQDIHKQQNLVIGLSPDLTAKTEIVISIHCAAKPGYIKTITPSQKKD